MDLRKQPDALQRIKEEAEKAKIALSSSQITTSTCRSSRRTPAGRSISRRTLTRAKMEQLTRRTFRTHHRAGESLLEGRGIEASKIDELVLVGGMTRMPRVVETAHTLVNKPPHQGVNPDEVVAIGAGIQGGVLKGEVKRTCSCST